MIVYYFIFSPSRHLLHISHWQTTLTSHTKRKPWLHGWTWWSVYILEKKFACENRYNIFRAKALLAARGSKRTKWPDLLWKMCCSPLICFPPPFLLMESGSPVLRDSISQGMRCEFAKCRTGNAQTLLAVGKWNIFLHSHELRYFGWKGNCRWSTEPNNNKWNWFLWNLGWNII